MIGLLGPGKEMGKKGENLLAGDYDECPLASQDEIINKGNKQKAILTANYGPAETEKRCGNCEYGQKLKGCGLGKNEVFCDVFQFKCSVDNVCNVYEPYEDEEEDEEEHED